MVEKQVIRYPDNMMIDVDALYRDRLKDPTPMPTGAVREESRVNNPLIQAALKPAQEEVEEKQAVREPASNTLLEDALVGATPALLGSIFGSTGVGPSNAALGAQRGMENISYLRDQRRQDELLKAKASAKTPSTKYQARDYRDEKGDYRIGAWDPVNRELITSPSDVRAAKFTTDDYQDRLERANKIKFGDISVPPQQWTELNKMSENFMTKRQWAADSLTSLDATSGLFEKLNNSENPGAVVNAIYDIAKINEPGGRLTDQDFARAGANVKSFRAAAQRAANKARLGQELTPTDLYYTAQLAKILAKKEIETLKRKQSRFINSKKSMLPEEGLVAASAIDYGPYEEAMAGLDAIMSRIKASGQLDRVPSIIGPSASKKERTATGSDLDAVLKDYK